MKYDTQNILYIIDNVGEDPLKLDISEFSCPQNLEIQSFLRNNAIDFAKKKMSITYLVTDKESQDIMGYFTLTHKVLSIPAEGMSNSVRKRMERYSKLNGDSQEYLVSAFLLAQFGKNYAVDNGQSISGTELMDCVNETLKDIQMRIGGGVVYLDCEDNDKLTAFYENKAGYRRISERTSAMDETKYLQYYRFI